MAGESLKDKINRLRGIISDKNAVKSSGSSEKKVDQVKDEQLNKFLNAFPEENNGEEKQYTMADLDNFIESVLKDKK